MVLIDEFPPLEPDEVVDVEPAPPPPTVTVYGVPAVTGKLVPFKKPPPPPPPLMLTPATPVPLPPTPATTK